MGNTREWYDHPTVKGRYAETRRDWDVLAKWAREAGVIGLDTEFYGLDVRKQSTVGRARVHVWSLALRTGKRSPLGFTRARGWVLPVEALDHPGLRAVLEDASITKYVHNQPVDDHALHNHGVDLRGCVNTLGLSRWAWPELVTDGGFGLKNLMSAKLQREPVCEFEDVVNDERMVQVSRMKLVSVTVCSCGEKGCRKRKGHEKTKTLEQVEVVREKLERFQHPLESIVPGHPRWELLVKYAAEDAVAALEIAELAESEENPAPWPYEDNGAGPANIRRRKYTRKSWRTPRPGFNQEVENQVVLMERTGFRIDTDYCTRMAVKAEEDEAAALRWLRKWYRANATLAPGDEVPDDDFLAVERDDEAIDAIWSSPKQLGEMFEALYFPRSPVWKKGKVKPGEMKLDATALEWIAKEYPPAKQLITKLLHLKRIRSGKKYLIKMRDCGGWVNPICGPAGDRDDRNGAVTGRLGIKGVLEAQQLPSREEADLYQIRKAVTA